MINFLADLETDWQPEPLLTRLIKSGSVSRFLLLQRKREGKISKRLTRSYVAVVLT